MLPDSVRADDELTNALDLTFCFEAWRRMRLEQRLSIKDAIGVWRRMARALLD